VCENRAGAWLTLQPDPSAVQLDELSRQRETEASAFLSAAPTCRNSSETAS
jgi:hypothetical protein